ncbi:MAG: universal stress protein [Anaerolineae bacterium]|nr:universal stress protein [Anaerolineae bacterium]
MYQTLLVPLDGSKLAERAVPVAAQLAQAVQARLVLLQAIGVHVAEARTYLGEIAIGLRARGLHVDTVVAPEPAAEAIVSFISTRPVDMVIMSTHGRSGLGRAVFGSVAEAVLTHSHVPILLLRSAKDVPDFAPAVHPRILVPLDGSHFAVAALPHAAALAKALDGTLVLTEVCLEPIDMSIWNANTRQLLNDIEHIHQRERRHAQGYLGHLQAQFEAEGLKVETCICRGAPGERVRQQCEQLGANLVVMATHGRSGVSRALMGSVALDVLHHGHLPMLLVHPTAHAQRAPEAEAVGLKPA